MSTCSCCGSDNQIKSSQFSESCREFYESEEFKSSKRQITKSHSHFVPNPAYIHPFRFSLLCITALRADWTLALKEASTANTEITQGLAGIISYAAL